MRPAGVRAAAPPPRRERLQSPPGPDVQRVLSVRERVAPEQVRRFTRAGLREVREHIESCGAQIDGPPFAIHHAVADGAIDVEVGWPVIGGHGDSRVCAGLLPRGLLKPAHAGADG